MRDDGGQLAQHGEAVARILWGEPNKRLSSKDELRWGDGGARAYHRKKGTFYDFSAEEGGGVLWAIERETGKQGADAFDWMRQNGIPLEDRREQMNGAGVSGADRKFMKLVATYDYVDEAGELVLQVCRYDPKEFRQRRRARPGDDPAKVKDGWVWSIKDVKQVPYRLVDLLEAVSSESLIFIAEGERDCDNLAKLGAPSTCNAAGAGKWPETLTPYFKDADVVILPDNDDPGRKHARVVAEALAGTARRIRVLNLPGLAEKADVSDWIDAGGTIEQLYDLVETTAREWSPESEPFVSAFGGAFIHDLAGLTLQRDWTVKGLLLARTFALVLGAPGCGKSFLILDLCMTLALAAARKQKDATWFGRKLKPCGVAYMAAEGQEDFIFRVRAWLNAKGLPEDTRLPFYLIPTAVDMRSDQATTDKLAADIGGASARADVEFGVGIGINIVDTVNRALAGGNENAPEVMGTFVINCGRLREATKAAVIGVHHVPEGASRSRGHGALHGATDAEILVHGAHGGKPNNWQLTRSKAGPTGARHEFRLGSHVLGEDEDGEDITSCVVIALGSEPSHEDAEMREASEAASTRKPTIAADGSVILGDNLTRMMRALQTAIEESGKEPPFGIRAPHGRRCVTYKHWTEEIIRAMPGDDKDSTKFRDRCRKARDAATLNLTKRNLIGADGDYVWRTERRVYGVPGERPFEKRETSERGRQISETVDNNSDPGGLL